MSNPFVTAPPASPAYVAGISAADSEAHHSDDPLDSLTTPPVRQSQAQRQVAGAPMRGKAILKYYAVSGGFDTKYDPHEFPAILEGHMPRSAFERYVKRLNEARSDFRANGVDTALLATAAVTLVTMIPFLIRRKSRALKRHKQEDIVFVDFEQEFPALRMRRDRVTHSVIIEANPLAEEQPGAWH
eukprot:m.16198 g.16198  ORF g.16198 m.16198 type:complete len:186 (+) comp6963_c0_seq1:370-927(+)